MKSAAVLWYNGDMVNRILRTSWAVRFIAGDRHIVGTTERRGYAEFWTPDTYALLYVTVDHRARWRYAVVKRLCTSTKFTVVARGLRSPEEAQQLLLVHAARLHPRPGVLPVKFIS